MKFVKVLAVAASVFVIGLCVTASRANSQDVAVKGTFTLPFEVHWGVAVLEPGEYTLSLPAAYTNLPVMYVSKQGKTVYITLGPGRSTAEPGPSYLRVENTGGMHIIRQFNSAVTGDLISFPVPKSVKNALIARNQSTTVPVSVAGK